jgi:arylsulfatase
VRWPGRIKPGLVLNEIASHQDWLPTLLAAAGEPDIAQKLLNGHQAGDKSFKVHIDGYNLLPYLTGEAKDGPRNFFFYIGDDGDILGIRMGDWKVVLMEQRAKQLMCWFEPFVKLRAPKIFNLRRDPFERADENSNTYWDWVLSHVYLLYENAGARRPTDPGLRAVSAAAEAGRIQPRRGAPQPPGGGGQQQSLAQ